MGFWVGIRRWGTAKGKIETPKRNYGETETSRVLIIALLDVEVTWLNCPKTLHAHFLLDSTTMTKGCENDGVFPFSDTASHLTRGTQSLKYS